MPKAEDSPFYKWVIVAVFFVVSTIMYGTQTSFGVFFKSISGEFGLFHGGFDTIIAALIGDTFGVRNIGMIMGSLQVTFGLGMVVGPTLAGILFDINQSYFMAFLIGAAAMFIVSLLISLTRREIG